MPRFHFNLREGGHLSLDDLGIEFSSLDEAYLEAFHAAQEIWVERVRERRTSRDCAFEITDGAGVLLLTLPFEEVMEQSKPSRPVSGGRSPAFLEALHNASRMKRLSIELSVQLRRTEEALRTSKALLARSEKASRFRMA